MDRARFDRKLLAIPVLGLLLATAAQARRIEAEVARVEFALGRVDALSVQLTGSPPGGRLELQLKAASLDAGATGYRFRDLAWTCTLTRDEAGGLHCAGEVRARGQGKAQLAASWSGGDIELAMRAASGSLSVLVPGDEASAIRFRAQDLPLPWLQPLLAAAWEPAMLNAGTLKGELALTSEGDATVLAGPLSLHGAGLDTRDGRIAVAGLDADGRLELRFEPERTRIATGWELRGGELLGGPVYVGLPASSVQLAVQADSAGDGRWNLGAVEWKDPQVLQLHAQAQLDTRLDDALRGLKLQAETGDLAQAHSRYLETALATLGLPDLQPGGTSRIGIEILDARLAGIEVDMSAVDAVDGGGRFAIHGLDGRLRWTAADTALDSLLRWREARLYRIGLGAVELPLRSRARELALRAPAAVTVLGGTLALSRFAWLPAVDDDGSTMLDLALELDAVDLGALSRALDWPAFGGTLSGRIPGVRYADSVLELQGGLQVEVFDGRVAIDALRLERPFGIAPTLAAEIMLAGLDLQPLTSAFGFGQITGRLDGAIRGLRLLDWTPVAFDADLHTRTSGGGPRRISQRAVDDLTRVGGGGIAAGLQATMLKMFDTFGYARIGLRCRLAQDVCYMDGLEPSGSGYLIVEGSGLPRITVIGHQRKVDWPVLLARLKAATDGQVPVFD